MTANKLRDAGVDESDEEDHDPTLTGAGKAIKKLMSKHEKNEAYDSDEESNPYASSVVRRYLFVRVRSNLFHRRKRKRRNPWLLMGQPSSNNSHQRVHPPMIRH